MSSSRRPPAPPDSRRARRTSQRAARREARDRDLARRRARVGGLSPTTWLTAAAVVVALLVIGVLVLANQASGGQPNPSAGLTAPSVVSPVALADGTAFGSSKAPVTVDLWADYQCPFCDAFTQTIEPQLVTTFVATGKARLVFHDYAFIGPESTAAAVAGTCADRQGRFWPYHDYLYANQAGENQGAFAQARLLLMATAVGLDPTAFRTCLSDPAVTTAVQQEHQQGAAAGVTATPAIFVNGKMLGGYDLATVSAAIESALGSATPGPLPSGSVTPIASPSI